MAAPSSARLVLGLFMLCALAAFGSSLLNEYTYDSYLIGRWTAPGGGPHSFATLLQPGEYSDATGVMSYRPLGVLVGYVFDVALFRGTAALSHLLNVFLHALNGWLLYLSLRLLSREEEATWPPILGAMFFMLHPLTTEVVFCAGFRFDILALLFVLAALYVVLRWRTILGAAALVLAGLLSKEIAVVALPILPAAVFLYRQDKREAILLAVALGAAFLLFLPAWLAFRFADYPTGYLGGGGRALGVANFLVTVSEIYLPRLVVPWPLRVDYGFEPVTSLGSGRVVLAVLVLIVVVAVAVFYSLRVSMAATGALWVLVAFLPISQIVPVPDPVAERFAYVPLVGVAFLLCGAMRHHLGRGHLSSERLVPAFLGLMLVYTALDIWRAQHWRDDVTLNIANWELAADTRPRALESLGYLYIQRGAAALARGDNRAASADFLAARGNLQRLLSDEPTHPQGLRLMVMWHLAQEDDEGARVAIEKAIELRPEDEALLELRRQLSIP